MSGSVSIGSGVSVAAVIAVLGIWPHLVPMLNWLLPILEREQVQAVLAALAGGAALGAVMPYILPKMWPPGRTRFVSGAASAVFSFAIAYTLVFTKIGFVYAMITGVASPTVAQGLMGMFYWLRPCAKPESLQE